MVYEALLFFAPPHQRCSLLHKKVRPLYIIGRTFIVFDLELSINLSLLLYHRLSTFATTIGVGHDVEVRGRDFVHFHRGFTVRKVSFT